MLIEEPNLMNFDSDARSPFFSLHCNSVAFSFCLALLQAFLFERSLFLSNSINSRWLKSPRTSTALSVWCFAGPR